MRLKSAMLRAPIKRCLPLLMPLLAAACVAAPPIASTPLACTSLIPDLWRTPVPGTPLPEGSTVADWTSFADKQTGQLDKANDRTLSTIGIIESCEARDREAVNRSKRKRLL